MTAKVTGVSDFPDVFKEQRSTSGIGQMDDQNDPVNMLLGLKNVRKAAHNCAVFQSGAKPGRIVIPSEVAIRETRQIPFEVDPPEHAGFRELLNPWFKRPLDDTYQASLQQIIDETIDSALRAQSLDIVSEFALPLQSKALTLLLNTTMDKAQIWIDWGTHVFRSEDSDLDGDKANILYDYIDNEIDNAIANPSDDLYSVLLAAQVNGQKMTKEQVKGVMILTFAGGRDTVINAITNSIAYFSENISDLQRIHAEPEIINRAVEELIRYFSPLTQMGRVATEDTQVCEHAIKADSRISLCWASANRDESVFKNPNNVDFDRKVNPHVSFGFSHHNCLGATHARQLLRQLVLSMASKVASIDIIKADENIEKLGEFSRKVGFNYLQVSIKAK
ncbi:Biotin biosynthesis cytochrome P450 [Pseudoalteromonas sp. P1-13-1a]|uniref:Cytochrome P450 n=1 Tax=Pseudoalteromonas undina TaxID=43660 RepID=A0ACC6R892_9GAMM|nr:cytochrome P450 [Pseudoalteromonas sp. P1-13-1a]KPZ59648.1 Biotin biosynthesis cytochrome P450 [Pseudoalteromonas sp. P1-13-1a]